MKAAEWLFYFLAGMICHDPFLKIEFTTCPSFSFLSGDIYSLMTMYRSIYERHKDMEVIRF